MLSHAAAAPFTTFASVVDSMVLMETAPASPAAPPTPTVPNTVVMVSPDTALISIAPYAFRFPPLFSATVELSMVLTDTVPPAPAKVDAARRYEVELTFAMSYAIIDSLSCAVTSESAIYALLSQSTSATETDPDTETDIYTEAENEAPATMTSTSSRVSVVTSTSFPNTTDLVTLSLSMYACVVLLMLVWSSAAPTATVPMVRPPALTSTSVL